MENKTFVASCMLAILVSYYTVWLLAASKWRRCEHLCIVSVACRSVVFPAASDWVIQRRSILFCRWCPTRYMYALLQLRAELMLVLFYCCTVLCYT